MAFPKIKRPGNLRKGGGNGCKGLQGELLRTFKSNPQQLVRREELLLKGGRHPGKHLFLKRKKKEVREKGLPKMRKRGDGGKGRSKDPHN